MVFFDKKEAFLKQIDILLRSRRYEKACELSKEFCARYNEGIAHLAAAKCLFWVGSYGEMLPEARKAMRMSIGKEKESAAVLLAAAYYKLGRLSDSQKTLSSLGHTKNVDAIKMKFMIAARRGRKKEQKDILRELSSIDSRVAEAFAMSILMQKGIETISTIRTVPKKVSPSKQK